MLSLLGILIISLTYAEICAGMRRTLKRVVHQSSGHSLVDLYCNNKISEVLSPSIVRRVIWKIVGITCTYVVFIPLKMLVNMLSFKVMRKLSQKVHNEAVQTSVVEDPLKVKCLHYRQQCDKWMDYKILSWALTQLDHEFPRKARGKKLQSETLWDYFENEEDGFEMFIRCLESSLQEPSFFHLGHYSLLKLLKETKDLTSDDDYICNSKIQEIIQNNALKFIELVNVQELLPIMENNWLLTNRDKELLRLNSYTDTDKAGYLLTELLSTKGHCGYNLFLECLEDEHSHSGHCDIFQKIKTELCNHKIYHLSKYSIKELQAFHQPEGLMNTHEYIEATEKFMYLSQSNNVHEFYSEIKLFVSFHNKTPEAEAFGFMMRALSLKFRCKHSKFCGLVFQIEQCINCIKNEVNKKSIKGNWYLMLSCWHRHQRRFKKAREFLEKAKSELISGNNRAHVLYNEASLLIEKETWRTRENKVIVTLLQDAIRGFHFNSDRISIMQARCYLKQAHCYIGSSLSSPCIAQRSPADLDKADSILTMLGKQLDALPLRLQMHYHTIMYDYHRVHNRTQQAIDCVKKGLSLDTSNQFKQDQKYLQHRDKAHVL